MGTDLLYANEAYQIVGAAMAVHSELGSAFLEAVYQEAMEIELAARQIPFRSQVPLQIRYREHVLRKSYIADFVCFDRVIVEIKAIERLTDTDIGQAINYLAATRLRLAILVNFGVPDRLDWKRVVR